MAHNLQFKTNPVSTFQDKKEKQVGKTSKAKGKKAKNADAEAEALLDAFGEENEEDGDEVLMLRTWWQQGSNFCASKINKYQGM